MTPEGHQDVASRFVVGDVGARDDEGVAAIRRRMPESHGGASMIRWKLRAAASAAVVGLTLTGFYLNPASARPPRAAIPAHPAKHTSGYDAAIHTGGPVHPRTGVG